ncbi:MAG: DNA-3-methyladenine glycosylase 2 family protein [Desulfobacteraceae bacterium]|nr:DNA-3-methyladenine glycosylase 2 family protein [Desulfobacteraceae bacterium]
MENSRHTLIKAMQSKDPAFDGRFFIGVKTTGIYCRPVCPARTPKPENVDFYKSASAAAHAGFRPCLRCRPECTPGNAAWMGTSSSVSRALKLITSTIHQDLSIKDLSLQLGMSDRHLRRLFSQHLGASPMSVIKTVRLHFALRLIRDSSLSMADTAFASGFKSIRSFNDTFKKRYGKSPLALRKNRQTQKEAHFTIHLFYHKPFHWDKIYKFLSFRRIPGVESCENGKYKRTIKVGDQTGMFEVRHLPDKQALELKIHFIDHTKLLLITEKVKSLFDLNAPACDIDDYLLNKSGLKKYTGMLSGIRVPGSWDFFELAMRAVIGQQISVKGATTILGRIADQLGEKVRGFNGLTRAFPSADQLCDADLTGIGLTRSRMDTILSLANCIREGKLDTSPYADPGQLKKDLLVIKGIGNWTAQYIIMRTVKYPDAFPEADLGLLKAVSLGTSSSDKKQLKHLSESWKPWRSYAAMYLWSTL